MPPIVINNITRDDVSVPNTTPERSNVSRSILPDIVASLSTINIVTTAPANANACIGHIPKRIDIVPPRVAPPETPIMYGSASGLRNNPWKAAPTIPSAPPANMARTSLGNLILVTTRREGMETPKKREMIDIKKSSKMRIRNIRLFLI